MIAIVDYGMGNLRSVWKAFRYLGADARLTQDPGELMAAERIVLPGVGAFRDCMANLNRLGLIDPLKEAIRRGTPYLGICLGLQILFTESTEFGRTPGLEILEGSVERFSADIPAGTAREAAPRKIPHMGWNSLRVIKEAPALKGIPQGSYFYFVHSYYVRPKAPHVIASLTEYGEEFASSVWTDNIFACQFHPEKSQALGLKLIENYLRHS